MAVPDYFKVTPGTAKVWKSSGGDYAITLTSLANAAARQGAKGDLGSVWAKKWHVFFTSSVGSAPTNGLEIELYWAASTNATAGTDNPGNTSGTDASLSNPSEVKLQLLYIGSLILSNSVGTGIQRQGFSFCPPTRYGMPVVVNSSGQTMGSTAGDHVITLTPLEDVIQDTV